MNLVKLYNERRHKKWIAKAKQLAFRPQPILVRDRILGYHLVYDVNNGDVIKLDRFSIKFKNDPNHRSGYSLYPLLISTYGIDIAMYRQEGNQPYKFPTEDEVINFINVLKRITLEYDLINLKSMYEVLPTSEYFSQLRESVSL